MHSVATGLADDFLVLGFYVYYQLFYLLSRRYATEVEKRFETWTIVRGDRQAPNCDNGRVFRTLQEGHVSNHCH
jgi:hypothetical protein